MSKAAIHVLEDGRQISIDRQFSWGKNEGNKGATRGKVRGFSAKSRRRLQGTFTRLRRNATALFLTLTYHETSPSCEVVKTHLDRFLKRLARFTSGRALFAIWKLEFQERGTPHLHILIYNCRYLPKDDLKRMWHEVTDETSTEHREVGAWIESALDGSKLSRYVAKYLSKVESTDASTGRVWGIWKRNNAPLANKWHSIPITYEAASFLIEHFLTLWGCQTEHIPRRLTLFTENPTDEVIRCLNLIDASL